MSGGHFDYKQHYINDIADDIESLIERQGKKIPHSELYGTRAYYAEHPEETIYGAYPIEIQARMREGIKALRIAAVYAQRIDWFLSGDDGEESFIERLKEELDAITKTE